MTARTMLLKTPDKEGWWLGVAPSGRELFVFVGEIESNVMTAWMPMDAVFDDGQPELTVIVYFEDGKSPDLIKNWLWREIEIPSHCPHFDTRDD